MNTEKICDKIRKLLAMGSSSNEAEAFAFLERAHAMLAEHNISIEQVLRPAHKLETDDAPMQRYGYGWNQRINLAVAKLYFCTYFQLDHPDGTRRYQFVGERHNLDVAQLMASYLVGFGKRASKQSSEGLVGKEKHRHNDQFLEAFSVRVAQRIKERIESTKTHTALPGYTTLPAVLDRHQQASAEQGRWLEETMGGSANSRVPSTEVVDPAALRAGYKAGDEVGLETQIGNTTTGRLQ